MTRSQDGVRFGCLRRAGQNRDAARQEDGVEPGGELAGAVPDQEFDSSRARAGFHQEATGGLGCPCAVGVRADTGQVGVAGAVLDDDQRVDAPQEHGVHVDEIDRQDAAGLGGQELLPGRARAAGRGVNPGVAQDLPDRRGSDRMAEPDEFALHAPVSPCRVLGGDADHQLADRGCRRRPPGTPPAGVVPLACGQAPVPGKQRRRVTANTSPHRCRGITRDSATSHSRPVGW